MYTLRLRETEVLITSADLKVLQADTQEWETDDAQSRYKQGVSDTTVLEEAMGSRRLRTCATGGGCGRSRFSTLDANPSAFDTEAAFKAAKSMTSLRWVNPVMLGRSLLQPPGRHLAQYCGLSLAL